MASPPSKRVKVEDTDTVELFNGEVPSNDFAPSIGSSEFLDVLESKYFVDKTPLIEDFLKHENKFIIINTPRKFGKSVNSHMIRAFLQVTADAQGNIVENNRTRELFEKTKIFSNKEFFDEHFNQHPVIYLDLKCGDSVDTLNGVLDVLSRSLHDSFRDHKYLENSPKLDEDEKTKFLKFTSMNTYIKLSESEVLNGLKDLAELLYKHFGKRVVLLVDEYDSCVCRSLYRDRMDTEKIGGLITDMLTYVLKNNDTKVMKALITGVVPIPVEGISSSNNIRRCGFLQSQFSKYYGLTGEEVKELLSRFEIAEDVMKDLLSWYGGYVAVDGATVFNTWSIVNYLHLKQLKNYWGQTGYIRNLDRLLYFPIVRDYLENLLQGLPITARFPKRKETKDLLILKDLLTRYPDERISNLNLLFVFLVELGYLIIADHSCPDVQKIEVPNTEVEVDLREYLLEHFTEVHHFSENKFEKAVFALDSLASCPDKSSLVSFVNTVDILFKSLHTEKFINLYDISIQCILYTVACKSLFACGIELGSYVNKTKPSIVLIKNDIALIFEVRRKSNAKEAYRQLVDKNYKQVVAGNDKVRKIVLIGLNVDAKLNVSIMYNLQGGEGEGMYIFPPLY